MENKNQFVCPIQLGSSNIDWALSTENFDGASSGIIVIKVTYQYLLSDDSSLANPHVWMMLNPQEEEDLLLKIPYALDKDSSPSEGDDLTVVPLREDPLFAIPYFEHKYSAPSVTKGDKFTLELVVDTRSIDFSGRNIVFRPQFRTVGSTRPVSAHNSQIPFKSFEIKCEEVQCQVEGVHSKVYACHRPNKP
ncbi:hypothetical protein OKW98_07070 [Pseudomonas sp. KU26590]|uniref:hypothetical protein n=1 Tax=Pseudomonas sp. KU26590 TaxID=2991051 RepID=UPI00223D6ABE|nr:hypothetical protein [Pseudomonas sp. KU26590]UZJ61473.1 hypothetical protein OKW98_07070 [Pseudomonas sp. KU26590]